MSQIYIWIHFTEIRRTANLNSTELESRQNDRTREESQGMQGDQRSQERGAHA